MRDRLIHGYSQVDLTIVWETATRLLSEVSCALEQETRGQEINRQSRQADLGSATDLSPEEKPGPEAANDA